MAILQPPLLLGMFLVSPGYPDHTGTAMSGPFIEQALFAGEMHRAGCSEINRQRHGLSSP